MNPDLAVGDWVMRCEAADPGRYPRARRQRRGGRPLLRDGGAGFGNQSRALPHVRAAVRARARQPADGGVDAEDAPAAAHLRAVFRCQPDDGDAQADDGLGPRASQRRRRGQSVPGVAGEDVEADRRGAGCLARHARSAVPKRLSLRSTARRALQAAVGIDPASTQPLRRPAKDPLHQELLHKRIAELKSRMPVGGMREATIRALLYVGMARERGRRARVRDRAPDSARARTSRAVLPLPEFKALVREQFYMLLIDEEAALAAIPDDAAGRRRSAPAGARYPKARTDRGWAARGRNAGAVGADRAAVCFGR